ncbi:TrmH family RNA methyltransferase [Aequorivita echinoideorum]|uniref:TrmH family RNA methyltransferase n=1 Tax=Aequorivita echinoideorum TaxID=1549647 RepID=A0ABS5S677_9FLAO|nr:TrmH family RNA methyltransferase [Aequorivita echinoideorum]MBT0608719.1 TrmH family RNA methyltransferase [Aequorivita echinoideorum]
MEQLQHRNSSFKAKQKQIIVICDGVNSPANIGSLFRICEAFGVLEIIFCNAEINLSSNRLLRTARNTISKVKHRISENILSEIENLEANNFELIALEITDESQSIENFVIQSNAKLALVIGNERSGISQAALDGIKKSIHITMFGENSSLNVTQATAIALHNFATKLN